MSSPIISSPSVASRYVSPTYAQVVTKALVTSSPHRQTTPDQPPNSLDLLIKTIQESSSLQSLQLPLKFKAEQIDSRGTTPLQAAINSHSLPIIEAVLSRSPLTHLLVTYQDKYPFEHVIEHCCNILRINQFSTQAACNLFLTKAQDFDKIIPPQRQAEFFSNLINREEIELFKRCLDRVSDPGKIIDSWGRTLLFYASQKSKSFKTLVLSKNVNFYFRPCLSYFSFQHLTCILTPRLQPLYVPDGDKNPDFHGSFHKDIYPPIRELFWQFTRQPRETYSPAVVSKWKNNFISLPREYLDSICNAILLPIQFASPQLYVNRVEQKLPTFIHTGWLEHAVNVVIANSYVFLINRGRTAQQQQKIIQVYRFQKELLTSAILKRLLLASGKPKTESEFTIYSWFLNEIRATKDPFCHFIERQHYLLKPQKGPNCVAANAKGAILCMLLACNANRMSYKICAKTYNYYRAFVEFTRFKIESAWISLKDLGAENSAVEI